jgi:hypothetical protein
MRLQSIKRQYAENLGRVSSVDNNLTGSQNSLASPKGSSFGDKNAKTRSVRVSDDSVRQEQMKKAEKGWNAHYRRKETQNFALAKLQAEAQTALKVCLFQYNPYLFNIESIFIVGHVGSVKISSRAQKRLQLCKCSSRSIGASFLPDCTP